MLIVPNFASTFVSMLPIDASRSCIRVCMVMSELTDLESWEGDLRIDGGLEGCVDGGLSDSSSVTLVVLREMPSYKSKCCPSLNVTDAVSSTDSIALKSRSQGIFEASLSSLEAFLSEGVIILC